jgi:hypothetical protein
MDRTDYRYNLEYRAEIRARIAKLATAYLGGTAGLIETARGLNEFTELEQEFSPSIGIFIGINSETDALPIGEARQLWNAEALAREDAKIAAAEQRWKAPATEAAKELLQLLKGRS